MVPGKALFLSIPGGKQPRALNEITFYKLKWWAKNTENVIIWYYFTIFLVGRISKYDDVIRYIVWNFGDSVKLTQWRTIDRRDMQMRVSIDSSKFQTLECGLTRVDNFPIDLCVMGHALDAGASATYNFDKFIHLPPSSARARETELSRKSSFSWQQFPHFSTPQGAQRIFRLKTGFQKSRVIVHFSYHHSDWSNEWILPLHVYYAYFDLKIAIRRIVCIPPSPSVQFLKALNSTFYHDYGRTSTVKNSREHKQNFPQKWTYFY